MKIGYDVSQTAENMAGCGFYSDQMIRAIAEIDNKNEYLLYPTFYSYRNPNFKKATKIDKNNFHTYFSGYSFDEMSKLWESIPHDEEIGSPDVIHSNNFSCPRNISAKVVMTLYDVGFLDCPEFTTEGNRLVCFNGMYEASIYAHHLVSISQFSKERFLHYFPHYPERNITVIHLGGRNTLSRMKQDEANTHLRHYIKNKDEQFWLAVGTVEPRKNLRTLIKAYAQYKNSSKSPIRLFVAGGKGWMEGDIHDYVTSLKLHDDIVFLGYVSDETLSALYSRCTAFIFPSYYEGFGLPPLEAMQCGAPIICSNTASLPEVVGDAGIYIDPYISEDITNAMLNLEKDQGLQAELSKKSLSRASYFSWDKAATEILNVYEKVYKS